MPVEPHRQELAALFARGAAFEAQGRLAEAATSYERVLELDARNVDARTLLGLLEVRGGRAWLAVPHFERALKLAPRSIDRHLDLAKLQLHLNRPDLALPLLLVARRLGPVSIELLHTQFKCAQQLGRAADAKRYILQALQLRPGDPELEVDLAQCLDFNGEPAAAQEIQRRVIAAGHRNVHAFDGFARSQRFTTEPPELARIEALLRDPATPTDDRTWLQRAAAKIADDLGRHDAAFGHLLASKSPERGWARAASFAARVALMRELITPEFLAARRAAGSPVARPIFVFGMPRSGTTLVEQILASHPAVHGADEQMFFLNAAHRTGLDADQRPELERALGALGRGAIEQLGRDYLHLLAAYSDQAERVVDKMPLNFEVLWLIALAFPRATFIHCRRDPVATCVSCFTQPLGPPHGAAHDLGALGAYYRSYRELMAHWTAVLPVRILELDYERLIDDQEAETRRLLAHAGLRWDDACLRFHEHQRHVRTPSRRQVEQPIYRTSLQAWRRYQDHLEPLFAALGDVAPADTPTPR